MVDLFAVLAVALSVLSLGSLVVLLGYLPTLRKAASAYQNSSEIISHMLEELNSRAALQDKKLADVQIRLDVLQDRWTRGGWTPIQTPIMQFPIDERTKSDLGTVRPHMESRQTEAPAMASAVRLRSISQGRRLSKADLLVLKDLEDRRLTAPEVRGVLGSSREHAARMMKSLADRGLVIRDSTKRPYSYEISDVGRDVVAAQGSKP